MTEAIVPPRQIIPIEGTYMLNGDTERGIHPENEIRDVIVRKFGLERFVQELAGEIEAVYTEPGIARSRRDQFAQQTGFATWECMIGQGSDYTVYKYIGSDPDHRKRGLATVWGNMMVIESATNHMRLMCGAGLPTMLRTATTTSLVLHKLNPELKTISVIGAGHQGQSTALTTAILSPNLEKILLSDKYPERAGKATRDFPDILEDVLGEERAHAITVEAVSTEDRRVGLESDAIVTATLGLPSEPPALSPSQLRPGVIIAAIGGDMVGKRELNPAIYDYAKFVTDEFAQSFREGELQHVGPWIGISKEDINARESSSFHGSLLGGRVIGISELLENTGAFTRRPEPITIYDATGFAGQDLAVARLLLRALTDMEYPLDPPFNGPSDPEERSRQFFETLLESAKYSSEGT